MRLTQACRRRSAWARTAKSCGPDTPTLVSSVACTKCDVTGARKPGPRGEREVSRKPLRREGRMFGQTCGSFPVLFYMHGGPWVRPAPGLPCALQCSRADDRAPLGRRTRRESADARRAQGSSRLVLRDVCCASSSG